VKIFLAISFLFTAVTSQCIAQDISGYWKGTLMMRGCFPENHIELQIDSKGNIVSGDSYHYQDIDNYVKKKFRGSFDRATRKLNVQEGIVTTYHIPQRCVICVKNFDLTYYRVGDVETLRGQWTGNVLGSMQSCDGGSIILTRIRESAFKEVPEIKVDTGSIRLDFYDNAQIDGDSISVLVDKQMVLSNQLLSAKPLTTYVKIDLNNTFHEVEMRAENLGTIPPNTAILIITAGKNRHLVSMSSSETKSARVRIVYDVDTTKISQTVAAVLKKENE
jgi:hypothetical protein